MRFGLGVFFSPSHIYTNIIFVVYFARGLLLSLKTNSVYHIMYADHYKSYAKQRQTRHIITQKRSKTKYSRKWDDNKNYRQFNIAMELKDEDITPHHTHTYNYIIWNKQPHSLWISKHCLENLQGENSICISFSLKLSKNLHNYLHTIQRSKSWCHLLLLKLLSWLNEMKM